MKVAENKSHQKDKIDIVPFAEHFQTFVKKSVPTCFLETENLFLTSSRRDWAFSGDSFSSEVELGDALLSSASGFL